MSSSPHRLIIEHLVPSSRWCCFGGLGNTFIGHAALLEKVHHSRADSGDLPLHSLLPVPIKLSSNTPLPCHHAMSSLTLWTSGLILKLLLFTVFYLSKVTNTASHATPPTGTTTQDMMRYTPPHFCLFVLFLRFHLLFVYVCLSVHVFSSTHGSQKGVLDPLELELEAFVSYPKWI